MHFLRNLKICEFIYSKELQNTQVNSNILLHFHMLFRPKNHEHAPTRNLPNIPPQEINDDIWRAVGSSIKRDEIDSFKT